MSIATIRDTIADPRPDLFLRPATGAELALVRFEAPVRSGVLVWVGVIACVSGTNTVAQINTCKNLLTFALN